MSAETDLELENVSETIENPESTVEFDTSKMHFKRQIGLLGGVSFVVGGIIGSGIFITPQGILRNTGSVGLSLVVWASSAVLSMLGALTFTELISVTRKSGGEYPVLLKTFGSVPAFVFVWSTEIAVNPAALAVEGLTFAEYFAAMFDICGSSVLMKKLVAISVLVVLAIINSYSVRLSARIQIFFTVAKLLALAMIIIGGIVKLSQGTVSDLFSGFEGSITSASSIALAFYSAMFSYGGWNNVFYLIEEIKRPRRNGPLSSIIGVIIVGVVYILTNMSYLAVMTKEDFYNSPAVAQMWGERVIKSVSWIIPVSVMMSVFGSINSEFGTSTRVQCIAARDGNWWEFLSFLQVRRHTPLPAILVRLVLSCIMVLQGSVTGLINFLSFTAWLFSGVAALCCIILRFKVKHDPKRIKIPLIISVLFMLWSFFLLIAPIVENPQIELLYAALFVVGGIVFYFPLVYLDIKPKFMESFEMYLQLLFEVSPSTYVADDF